MDLQTYILLMRNGEIPDFPANANSLAFAQGLDAQDQLSGFRDEFVLPTKASLKGRALSRTRVGNEGSNDTLPGDSSEPSLYFVGNSLGAQPKIVREYINAQLDSWAALGVTGHYTRMDGSPLVPWIEMVEDCAKKSAEIVGASPSEIVIMNTLTVNLHLMLASFYKPDAKRHKIILEWKPFPSDYYLIESQLLWHGLNPAESMVLIEPDSNCYISTEDILKTIDEHADDAAVILLPGIQYYSGQLFDMPRITAYAKRHGIIVGWDLAHAVGNVELQLHDWDVDFACWCNYKYMNGGPGAISGTFVHEKYGSVQWKDGASKPSYQPRLAGWYGGDMSVRFNMDKVFVPTAGAAGYQLSTPSAIELATLSAALSVFNKTSMRDLRSKSLVLTAYAEFLLDGILVERPNDEEPVFRIMTPREPASRGAQLSILLREELLEKVSGVLEANGAICDKRKPGIIRVAPVPLYTRFEDVWAFVQVFKQALQT